MNENNIDDMIKTFENDGVFIWTEENRLKYKSKNPLKNQQLEMLKEYKEKIINFLNIKDKQINDYPIIATQNQKALWLNYKMNKDSWSFNNLILLKINRNISFQIVRSTFDQMLKEAPIFSSIFYEQDDELHMRIDDISTKNYYSVIQCETDESEKDEIKHEAYRPFELETGPLLRIRVIDNKKKLDHYKLLIVVHHIISDAYTCKLIYNRFVHIVDPTIESGGKLYDTSFGKNYIEYVKYEQDLLQFEKGNKLFDYWREKLEGKEFIAKLPYEKKTYEFKVGSEELYLYSDEYNKLKNMVAENYSTVPSVILGMFTIVINKITDVNDIVIGTTMQNRVIKEFRNTIGYFANLNALVINVDKQMKVSDHCKIVLKEFMETLEYQEYPFPLIVKKLNPKRDNGHTPFFNIVFDSIIFNDDVLKSTLIEEEEIFQGFGGFDLLLLAREVNKNLKLEFRYNSKKYGSSYIRAIRDCMVNVIEQMLNDFNVPIYKIKYINDTIQNEIIEKAIYQTKNELSGLKPIHEEFNKIANEIPENISIYSDGRKITYKQLVQYSSYIANNLQKNIGIKKADLVGLYVDRSESLIIGIIAILKAGGTYIPFDPEWPLQRIASIINETKIQTVITVPKYKHNVDKLQWESDVFDNYICIDNNYGLNNDADNYNQKNYKNVWKYISDNTNSNLEKGYWKSSYTGIPFSDEEMIDYYNNCLIKVKPYIEMDKEVLEIGCGSGYLAFELASCAKSYKGVDIVDDIILNNTNKATELNLNNLIFEVLGANEISKLNNEKYDMVILNSVVQYFPGHEYFRDVLKQIITICKDKARVFIGDIMDVDKKELLLKRLDKYKNSNPSSFTKMDFSKELFLSKDFFNDICNEYQEIKACQISEKKCKYINEMSEFRYDVILSVEKKSEKKLVNSKKKYQFTINLNEATCFKSDENDVVSLNSLAYVMYTSGSTGKPKGVMIEHNALVNFRFGMIKKLRLENINKVLCVTTVSFDIFFLETLFPLSIGKQVYIANDDEQKDPRKLIDMIQKEKIEMIQMTPSRYQMVLESMRPGERLNSVKILLVGGEKVSKDLVKNLEQISSAEIYNVYGPTETTIWSSIGRICSSEEINIGEPIANTQIYIMDEDGNVLPQGFLGEIYIGGEGLARGYFSDNDLTEKKFAKKVNGGRLYATGDIGYYNTESKIVYVKRKDNQVKIRGYRVEIGDVETSLLTINGITQCVIIDYVTEIGFTELKAYITINNTITLNEVRVKIKDILPIYMVPTKIIVLENMPLMPNGKIDRKKLSEMKEVENKTTISSKLDAKEEEIAIADIWAGTLGRKIIQYTENYFDMGGHSLSLPMIKNQLEEKFKVEIEIIDLFNYTTIYSLAEFIRNKHTATVKREQLNKIDKNSKLKQLRTKRIRNK